MNKGGEAMTDDEMKLIAGAHDWIYRNCEDGARYSYGANHMAYRHVGVGMPWHLTDAGAFRILVESHLSFEADSHRGEKCYWCNQWPDDDREEIFYVNPEGNCYWYSPHEAIAQAELARLKQ